MFPSPKRAFEFHPLSHIVPTIETTLPNQTFLPMQTALSLPDPHSSWLNPSLLLHHAYSKHQVSIAYGEQTRQLPAGAPRPASLENPRHQPTTPSILILTVFLISVSSPPGTIRRRACMCVTQFWKRGTKVWTLLFCYL